MARTITAELFASLDLVVEAPETWHFPWVGEEMLAEVAREQGEASALLLGRRTYEVFADSWPNRGDEVPLARRLNAMPKLVVSSTLDSPTWRNTEVTGFDELAAHKASGEGRITVAGSIRLVEALIAGGLLDELRLLTHPVVLGQGRRLFDTYDGPRADLELVESRMLERGVQLTVHRPTARP
ncbi:dihydrofolate reductase [Agromyces hippuratus]|uniref:Dihydrofolate reductase n=1 Tax=Agromyces hippuratus TaxID=286438 RepID=A0A852WXT3_9MICO|nr:dihydrofolate reductase family protein [Agromyces hippuratus]NYG19884.1 dihydrofolate reductase [Agromyces hippuratus]